MWATSRMGRASQSTPYPFAGRVRGDQQWSWTLQVWNGCVVIGSEFVQRVRLVLDWYGPCAGRTTLKW
jgi:hypothetical protein